jgi:hypothetical protein
MGSGVSDSANPISRQDITSFNKRTFEMNRVSAALNPPGRQAVTARLLARSPRTMIIALAAALSLAACGGSPSESDVHAALGKQIDAGQEQARQLMGKSSFIDQQAEQQRQEIAGIKLIGCKSDGEKAYLCDIEGKAGAGRIRMLKGSEGWLASDPGKG